MRVLRNDRYSRGFDRVKRARISGLNFALMFAAVGLLMLYRIDHPATGWMKRAVAGLAEAPARQIGAMTEPLRDCVSQLTYFFTVREELASLRREVAVLESVRARADALAAENSSLQRLLKAVPSGKNTDFITARVVSGSRSPFGRSVTVAAGRQHGVRYGQPVLDEDGLVGRVVETGEDWARVLLLSDLNSRIPVEVGQARVPALAVGDDAAAPRLVYLPPDASFEPGALVVSSGAAGEFPRGIELGTVAIEQGVARVNTHSRLLAKTFVFIRMDDLPSLADTRPPRKQRLVANPVEGRRQ